MIQKTPAPVRRSRGRPSTQSNATPVRELLLEAAIELVRDFGPTDTNATQVAERAGARPSTINYHFSSLDYLLAEAGRRVYGEQTTFRWDTVAQADRNPEARLRAYVHSQQEWARQNPGWAAFFNFPLSAKRASDLMFERFGGEIRELFELNYARFYRLAKDVSMGVVTPADDWSEHADHAEILGDREILLEAIVMGWSTLGMVVWGARRHDDQLGGAVVREFNQAAVEYALEASIERLKQRGSAGS